MEILTVNFEKEIDYKELYGLLKKTNKTFQMFNSETILNEQHILFAFECAKKDFDEKTNISENIEMQLLLRVGATAKINKAIEKVGFKGGKSAVLAFFEKLNIPNHWKTKKTEGNIEKIKKIFDLNDEYIKACGNVENALFETIALSQL